VTTRAAQIELLADSLIDPTTGAVCAGYTAYFYAAGTSTAKNVWTEKEKTNPFTSYALDSGGKVLLYGDGIYKIVVKNPDGATVLSLDNQKIKANNFSVVTKIADYTATPDDDVILCEGTFTVTLQAVSLYEHEIDILNNGAGTISFVCASGSTISGNWPTGNLEIFSNQKIRIAPDPDSGMWIRLDFSYDANGVEFTLDADGDTSITADTDDQIDIKIAGSDKFRFTTAGFVEVGGATRTSEVYTFASGNTKTYDMVLTYGRIYKLTYALKMPTNSTSLGIRFNADTGNNYTYFGHSAYDSGGGVTSGHGGTEGTNLILVTGALNSITDGYMSGEITIGLSGNDNTATVISRAVQYYSTGDYESSTNGGVYVGASAITSITFFATGAAGNMVGPTVLERIA
jgi:hypothetical protein